MKFKIKIKDLYFTHTQVYSIVLHLAGIVTIGIIWAHLIDNHSRLFEIPITVGAWIAVGVAIFSLLDYLDIIKYRKSHERLTKCIVCDRTNKVNKFVDKSKIITDVRKTGSDEYDDPLDKETTIKKITTKEKPEIPLHGIIVYDKMICIECMKKIKGLFKD